MGALLLSEAPDLQSQVDLLTLTPESAARRGSDARGSVGAGWAQVAYGSAAAGWFPLSSCQGSLTCTFTTAMQINITFTITSILPRARREKQRNASGGVSWLAEPGRASVRPITTGERNRHIIPTHPMPFLPHARQAERDTQARQSTRWMPRR